MLLQLFYKLTSISIQQVTEDPGPVQEEAVTPEYLMQQWTALWKPLEGQLVLLASQSQMTIMQQAFLTAAQKIFTPGHDGLQLVRTQL